MSRAISRMMLVVAVVCGMAVVSQAGQTTTSTQQTKSFEVLSVQGSQLVVRLPEGTRELTVPDDFRFTVDGKQLALAELKPGMKGTATITDEDDGHPGHRDGGEKRHRHADHLEGLSS